MKLIVEAGNYEVTGLRFPLPVLLWSVFKHRACHWLRGEGWND